LIYSRIQLFPEYYNYVIFCIIFFVSIIFLIYFLRGGESFTDTWTYLKIVAVLGAFVLFLLVFSLEYLVIYITFGVDSGSESWIFVLVNSLLLGIFLNVCGIHFNRKNKNGNSQKLLLLFSLIYLGLTGLGYLGILLEIRKPISNYLIYRFIQSNSAHTIWFVFYNFPIFILIFFISFVLEKEKE